MYTEVVKTDDDWFCFSENRSWFKFDVMSLIFIITITLVISQSKILQFKHLKSVVIVQTGVTFGCHIYLGLQRSKKQLYFIVTGQNNVYTTKHKRKPWIKAFQRNGKSKLLYLWNWNQELHPALYHCTTVQRLYKHWSCSVLIVKLTITKTLKTMKTAAVFVFLACILAMEVEGECCLLRPII